MLRRQTRDTIGPKLGSHAAFASEAPSDLDNLTGTQLGKSKATQGLHVNEDVLSALTPCQKSKSADPVEPFDHGSFPVAFRLDYDVGPLRKLRWVNTSAFVNAQDPEGLHALGSPEHLTMNASPLISGLVAASPEAGDMEQHVSQAVVRHNETISFGGVEPLDRACNLEHLEPSGIEQLLVLFRRQIARRANQSLGNAL